MKINITGDFIIPSGYVSLNGTYIVSGKFVVPEDSYVIVDKYDESLDGTGYLEIYAREIIINGIINADGAGYWGGAGGGGGSGNQRWPGWAGISGTSPHVNSNAGLASGSVDRTKITGGPNYGSGVCHVNTGDARLDKKVPDPWLKAAGKEGGGDGRCFGAYGGNGGGPLGGSGGGQDTTIHYFNYSTGTWSTAPYRVGGMAENNKPIDYTTAYGRPAGYFQNGQHGADGGGGVILPVSEGGSVCEVVNYHLLMGSGGGGGGGGSGAAREYLQTNCGGGGGGGAGARGGGCIKLFGYDRLKITGYVLARGSLFASSGSPGASFEVIPNHIYESEPGITASNEEPEPGNKYWWNVFKNPYVESQLGPIDFCGTGGDGGSSLVLDSNPNMQSGIGGEGGNFKQWAEGVVWARTATGFDYWDGNKQQTVEFGGNGGCGGGGGGGGILLFTFGEMEIDNSENISCLGTVRNYNKPDMPLEYSINNAGTIKVFFGYSAIINNVTVIKYRALNEDINVLAYRFKNCAYRHLFSTWSESLPNKYFKPPTVKGIFRLPIGSCDVPQDVGINWESVVDKDLAGYYIYINQPDFNRHVEGNIDKNINNFSTVERYFSPKHYIKARVDSKFWSHRGYPNVEGRNLVERSLPSYREISSNPKGCFICKYKEYERLINGYNHTLCENLTYPKNLKVTPKTPLISINTTFEWEDPSCIDGLKQYKVEIIGKGYNSTRYFSPTDPKKLVIALPHKGDYIFIVTAEHKTEGCPSKSTNITFTATDIPPTPDKPEIISPEGCISIQRDGKGPIRFDVKTFKNTTHVNIEIKEVDPIDTNISLEEYHSISGDIPINSLPFIKRGNPTLKRAVYKYRAKAINKILASNQPHAYSDEVVFYIEKILKKPEFIPNPDNAYMAGSIIEIHGTDKLDFYDYWKYGSTRLYVETDKNAKGTYYDDTNTLVSVSGKSWNSLYPPISVELPVGSSFISFKAKGQEYCALPTEISVGYGIVNYDDPIIDFYVISGITIESDFSYNYNNYNPNVEAYKNTSSIWNSFISGYAPNLTVTFQESCIPDLTPISAYEWNFGDYYNESTNFEGIYITNPNDILTGRIYPYKSRANFITTKTDHRVQHTYIMPGYYDITLTVAGSTVKDKIYSVSKSKTKFNTYRTHYVYVEEIPPKCCFELAQIGTEFSSTSSPNGCSPLTVYAIASCLSAGSFPIHELDFDWGDGSEITVIDNYPDMLFDPLTTIATHTYRRLYDNDPQIFTVTMTAYAAYTDTSVICNLTVGPVTSVSIDDIVDANQVRLIKNRMFNKDNNNILVFENQKNLETYNLLLSGK